MFELYWRISRLRITVENFAVPSSAIGPYSGVFETDIGDVVSERERICSNTGPSASGTISDPGMFDILVGITVNLSSSLYHESSGVFLPDIDVFAREAEGGLGVSGPNSDVVYTDVSGFDATFLGVSIPMYENVPTTGSIVVDAIEWLEYRDENDNSPVWGRYTGSKLVSQVPMGA